MKAAEVAPSGGLRTIDEIDGLSRGSRVEPRWTEYDWPKAPGLHKSFLQMEAFGAACRIDRRKKKAGWWALDDLISVVSGHTDAHALGSGWILLRPVDLIKIMAIFRMMNVDDRLEICLPPAYRQIADSLPRDADEQIKAAVALAAGEPKD